jgi:hypothetical protein
MVLEISVLMAAFPSKEIAELSYKYRTLGLGYANLGAMLMQAGIPYDSDEAAGGVRDAVGDPDGSFVPHVGADGEGARRVPGV